MPSAGPSLRFKTPVSLTFSPATILLLSEWNDSRTVKITCNINVFSRVFSHNKCYRLPLLMTALVCLLRLARLETGSSRSGIHVLFWLLVRLVSSNWSTPAWLHLSNTCSQLVHLLLVVILNLLCFICNTCSWWLFHYLWKDPHVILNQILKYYLIFFVALSDKCIIFDSALRIQLDWQCICTGSRLQKGTTKKALNWWIDTRTDFLGDCEF